MKILLYYSRNSKTIPMKKFCNFCAQKHPTLLNINEKTHWLTVNMKHPLEMLQIFKNGNLEDQTAVPSLICGNCLQLLESAYNFYQIFLKSQTILKTFQDQVKSSKNQLIFPKTILDEPIADLKTTETKPNGNQTRFYKCLECPVKFKSHKHLKHHESSHENSQICKYCNNAIYLEDQMRLHCDENHTNLKYKCRICDNKYFSNKFLLLNHFKNVHKTMEMLYFCSECPFAELKGIKELLDHMKTTHSNVKIDENSDDLCMHEEFLDEFFLNQDENSFQFNDYWDNLSLGFDDELKLKSNDLSVDSRYKCPICLQDFAKQHQMRLHLAEAHAEYVLICNVCGRKFNKTDELRVHKQEHTFKPVKFECEVCDKMFKTDQGFKYHLARHNNEKNLPCVYCGKLFLTVVNLSAHIKAVHSNTKTHTCSLCDRKFATLDHLKKHVMSSHQRERNFLCSVCGKGFGQTSHLKQHSLIHFKETKSEERASEKIMWDHSYI